MFALTRVAAFLICLSTACLKVTGQIPRAEIPGSQVGFNAGVQDGEYLARAEENRFSSDSLGTVSVEELRHPLSRRAERQLDQVQRDVRKGDHLAAIRKLTELQDDSSAQLIVAGMLGTEYLALGRFAEAAPYLETAARLHPNLAGTHSNLGYALCALGQIERGEAEVRAALLLDGKSFQARYLMGILLVGRDDPRALDELHFAEKDIPAAHMIEALYYAGHDEMDLANQQMLEYLGPQDAARLPAAQQWVRTVLAHSE
jgi:tetratricopeptide (TPR) repeat protein